MPKTVKTPDILVSDSRLDGAELFQQTVADVPFVRITDATHGAIRLEVQFDYAIRVSVENREYIIFLEEKTQGEPRWLRPAIEHLSYRRCEYIRRSGIRPEEVAAVIVAPYISPDMAQECRDAGLGYIDRAGNCHLIFGTVYIHREGKPNPVRRAPSLRTLFSPKAERVLRVLLTYPNRSWRTVRLAKEASVSVGQIAKVKQALHEQEMLKETREGISLVKPNELLSLWATDYAKRPEEKIGEVGNYYAMASLQELEEKLIEQVKEDPDFAIGGYTLAGLSAANHLSPYARSPRLTITARRDVVEIYLTIMLDLKPVDSGANVVITIPYDEGVLYGNAVFDGLPISSPIQVYLDTYRLGGRAREGAEQLKNEVLIRLWNQTAS